MIPWKLTTVAIDERRNHEGDWRRYGERRLILDFRHHGARRDMRWVSDKKLIGFGEADDSARYLHGKTGVGTCLVADQESQHVNLSIM